MEKDDLARIDFQDPSFILQNINYTHNFAQDVNFSNDARDNMIQTMCDQVCYYVMCAFRAFHVARTSSAFSFQDKFNYKPPGILVYGCGVVGECVLDALKDMGCAPFIKVFSRDSQSAKSMAKKGFRSTVELKFGYEIDILLINSNISSFGQLCRDLSQFITSKTFIISNVFCLQRQRMYNLFGTPGIVRTFVERKGASKTSKERGMLGRTYSARMLASRVNGVKNLILVLENWMMAIDIHKETARREAIHMVVGSDRVSMDRNNMNSPYKHKKPISFSDVGESSDEEYYSDSDSDSSLPETYPPVVDNNRLSTFRRLRSFEADEKQENEKDGRNTASKKHKQKKGHGDAENDVNAEDINCQSEAVPAADVPHSSPVSRRRFTAAPVMQLGSQKPSHASAGLAKDSTSAENNSSPNSNQRDSIRSNVSALSNEEADASSKENTGGDTFSLERNRLPTPEFYSKENKRKGSVNINSNNAAALQKQRSPLQRSLSSNPTRKEKEDRDTLKRVLGISKSEMRSKTQDFCSVAVAIANRQNEIKRAKNSPLFKITRDLEKRYGELFRKELAKHIYVVDLPTLDSLKQSDPRKKRINSFVGTMLAQRADMARRRTSFLSGVPIVANRKPVGYLDSKTLLDIFCSDKKSSEVVDEKSQLLKDMDDGSDNDGEKEDEDNDLFLEDVPRDKFRFFILENDVGETAENPAHRKSSTSSLQSMQSGH